MAKPRDCEVCGKEYKPWNKLQRFCTKTCKGKWKYQEGIITTNSQYKLISGNWHKYYQRLLYCHNRKRDGLTLETLKILHEEQNGLCALTGVNLTCQLEKGIKCPTNSSIDRIEAGGPYIKENIQLVCSAINKLRMDLSLEEFKWWCKRVIEYDS